MRKYDFRELAERVTSLTAYRVATSSPAATTIATTAVAMDDTALTVAAITGFANADVVCALGQNGDGDVVAINATPSGSSLALATPIKVPLAIGSKVQKMTGTTLGDFKGGISFTGASTLNKIYGSISKLPAGSFINQAAIGGKVALLGLNPENLQFAFGAPEATSGSGSAAAPWSGAIRGSQIGTHGLTCIRAQGLMNDGLTVFTLDWIACKLSAAINSTLGDGTNAATVDAQWDASCLVFRDSDH